VAGLTTAEIAHAFLVPEATMAQRISRAKQLIKKSGVGFQMPSPSERDERLEAVLHVLYLIFNEGYAASGGESLQRVDLSSEAIRLSRAVQRLLPEDGEAAGLLALMLLTDARRRARTGAAGEIIPLDEQDRTQKAWRWWVEQCRGARWAHTSCKPLLLPATMKPRAWRTPIGRRSWLCMGCCSACRITRC
jgi:predicted RNA polymerase sigma factor